MASCRSVEQGFKYQRVLSAESVPYSDVFFNQAQVFEASEYAPRCATNSGSMVLDVRRGRKGNFGMPNR